MKINLRYWLKKTGKNILGLSPDVWVAWIGVYMLLVLFSQRSPSRMGEILVGFIAFSFALSIYSIILYTGLQEEKSKKLFKDLIPRAIQFFDAGLMLISTYLFHSAVQITSEAMIKVIWLSFSMVFLGLGLMLLIDAVVALVAATHDIRRRVE
ncbi:hypothetical protein ACFLRC_00055 [Candidatus Altiarchaeota archaeon]